MAELIELDYDPFEERDEPQAPALTSVEPAKSAVPEPTPEPAAEPESKADYVIPPAPTLPTVKFAGEEKAKPKKEPELIELDYDPFVEPEKPGDKGTFIKEAPKAVAAGAVEAAGGIIRGLGAQRQESMATRAQEAARAKVLADLGYTGMVDFRTLPEDKKKQLVDALRAANDSVEFKLEDDPFYQAGLATSDWGKEQFKAARDYENSWTRQIGEGLGSTLPYLATAAAGPMGFVAGLEMGFAGSAGEAVDRAIKAGAKPEQILQAIRYGQAIGGTEQLGAEAILAKIPVGSWGKVITVLGRLGAKAMAEGGQEAVSTLFQNLNEKYAYDPNQDITEGVAQAAGIGAIVGGIAGAPSAVSGEEKPAKVDDTPEVSTETLPEGTPAQVSPAIGEPTPGSLGADIPVQPAGAEKQPEQPPSLIPIEPEDPRTVTKPPTPAVPAAPAGGGGVTVVDPSSAAPDVAAAAAGTPITQPIFPTSDEAAAAAAREQEPDEFNIRETLPETATETEAAAATAAHEARVAGLFRDELEAEKRQEEMAGRTRVATTGDDIAAALGAVPAAPQVRQPETLGTGVALTRTAEQPAAAAPAITAAPERVPSATAEQVTLPTPAVGTSAVPPPTPLRPAETPTEPALVQGEPAADIPVAAFVAGTPAAPAGETLPTEKAAPPPAAQPVAPAPVVGEPKAVEPIAKPTISLKPGAKGAAVKAKAKAKEAAPEAKAAAAPTAQPEAERAPATAPVAEEGPKEPVRTNLSRDAAKSARDIPALQGSPVYRLDEFPDTLEDVAAEVVARNRRENPQASPREIIDKSRQEIADTVQQRLAERQKEVKAADEALFERVEREAAEEAISLKERKAKEEKAAEEAEAKRIREEGKAQEKKRAGKGVVAKQPEDILAESEEATMRAVKKELQKPEADRDPTLMAWLEEHQKQARLPKNPTPEKKQAVEEKRAGHVARKKELQAERAKAVEKLIAEKGQLTDRAWGVRQKLRPLFEKLPLPQMAGTDVQQDQAARAYLREFVQAIRDARLPLADHIDRTYQSIEENLAIYAQKIAKRDPELVGDDAQDFAAARLYQMAGFDKDFYGLTTNEKIKGSQYREELGADEKPGLSADEQALIRSGRAEVRERDAARKAREEAAYQDFRRVEVTRPNGSVVSVRAETRKASSVLREVNRLLSADRPRGFISTIQNALVKHLTQMVGNVDVHFVSSADMRKLHDKGQRAAGLYYNYSPAQRLKGMKPQVFIDEELVFDSSAYAHTVLHELTHAATSLALRENIRGTKSLVEDMMVSLMGQMTPQQISEFDYAFTNEAEFIAEAFSNVRFQAALSAIRMPEDIRRQVGGIAADRRPTWWDGVVAMVSNAVGIVWGQRGQSYMEQIVKLYPSLAYSEQGQRQLAREAVEKQGLPRPMPGAVPASMDIDALNFDFLQIGNAAKSRTVNAFTPENRRKRDIFSTSGELIRRSEELFGGALNALERKLRIHLKRDKIRANYRKEAGPGIKSNELEQAQADLQIRDKAEYNKLSSFLHEQSRYSLDATVPLTDPVNSHIQKTGARHRQARAKHAALEQEFATLSPEAQALARKTIDHYRAAKDQGSADIIRHGIDNAIQYGRNLPAGKTMQDAVDWIMSGDAAKDVANQTQVDKDFHSALGKTAETLAKVPFLRKTKGAYVPFMRRGKYFISATERPFGTLANPKNVPAGAVLDAENRLLFRNEADLNAFADTYGGQLSVKSAYYNPYTGQRTTSAPFAHPQNPTQLLVPKKLFVAEVQNRRVEMSDNYSHLVGRAKQLRAEGHHASDVGISKTHLEESVRQLQSPEVARLIKNLEQTTIGQNTVAQQAVAAAVNDAFLRSLTTPGALARGLRRDNVLGEDLDLVKATRDYNRDFAHHKATLELAPQMAKADQDVKDYIKQQQHLEPPGSGRTIARQSMNAEVDHRILGYQGDFADGKLAHVMKVVRDITFLRHLFSPHYTIMQLVQPYMTTAPVLNARYGPGATSRELRRAYRLGLKTTGAGFRQLGRSIVDVGRKVPKEAISQDEFWQNLVAGEPDGPQLQEALNEAVLNGWGASSGIEASSISELDMNLFEKGVNRMLGMAKSLPEWAEGINRGVTVVATYRLAIRAGKSHQAAVREAALTVEETQGGYGAANNPTFFQNPLLQPATQFRKYSLAYGQLFYKNMMWSIGRDPQKRKQAIKALAGLALTIVSLAGISGLPLVEPLRVVVNILAARGLLEEDWEETETGIQKWLAEMVQWVTGSKSLGEALAEANVRGYTRLANIDTSNMFGADSLVLFGQPKDLDAEGVFAWLGKAVIGASGGMLFDSGKALVNGDMEDVIPWPKLVTNVMKAIELKTKGTVHKETGEEFHKPFSTYESVVKGLGFRPAEESRAFEGGGASKGKAERKENKERRTLMARWRNAGPAEKQRIWREEIRGGWNREHRNPDDKIQMQDLLRSKRAKKAEERRRKREEMYEE